MVKPPAVTVEFPVLVPYDEGARGVLEGRADLHDLTGCAGGPPGRKCKHPRSICVAADRRVVGVRYFLRDPPLRLPFFGTFAPDSRASDNPIAIACFRLVTVLPDRPLLSVPCFRSCMARSTFSDAFLPYLAMNSSP